MNRTPILSKKPETGPDGKLTQHGRQELSRAVFASMREDLFPEAQMRLAQKLQEWTDKSDFPAASILYPTVSKFLQTTQYDEGWRQCFKVLDFANTRKSGFRLLTLANTIVPNLVPAGDKAHVFNITGSTATVAFDKYGAALEWDKTLIEDDEWVQLEDIIFSFRAEMMNHMAQVHYDLLEAAGDAKVAITWQLPEPAALANTVETYTANRDSETINLGAQTMLLANRNKGYGVSASSNLILLSPLQLRKRARKALNLLLQAVTNSTTNIDYNITLVTTMMLTTTNAWRLILPGGKLQTGIRMNLEELKDVDILARSEIQADWMRFGAAVGDSDQIETLATA